MSAIEDAPTYLLLVGFPPLGASSKKLATSVLMLFSEYNLITRFISFAEPDTRLYIFYFFSDNLDKAIGTMSITILAP